MKTSTKNTIIGCVLTAALSAFGTERAYSYLNQSRDQNQAQNQSVTLNVNGQEVSYGSEDVEQLNKRIEKLEKENQNLREADSHSKAQTVNVNKEISDVTNDTTYLNELPIFNCQYYSGYNDSWNSSELIKWNALDDRAADGNKYDNVVHMAVEGYAKIYVIDYLLDSKYHVFNGNFMLDETSKSTSSQATLRIYGDDNIIYEYNGVTGGLVPQNTGDLSVENVEKLRFEFSSPNDDLGNTYNQYFGVIFYDSLLF